ncbi:hypothetical protein PI125_g26439 [Phytophthora idaei]|nr:hypothetical protein PI125_g26439 [Phytophthora idaei]KAG3118615.1 hypothetical protein PI126_g24570 [Phytophthora idaei]
MKSAGQVKHRKNAKEGESAIGFGTNVKWKKKPKKNRKRGESAIVFGTNDNWKRNPGATGSTPKARSSSSPRKSSLDSTRRAGRAGAHAA